MQGQIRIPTLLAARLESDSTLHASVIAALSDFEPWLAHSKTPFFPDFTDHGPVHVTETLMAAVSLITPESEHLISPADSAVLILAAVLHDSALHIAEEGMATLLRTKYGERGCPHFSEENWPTAWEKFLFDAARWPEARISEVFSREALKLEPSFKAPNIDEPLELTLRDRLLIGEFIRKHHARLAHEFAIFGVPGPNSAGLSLDAHLSFDLRNLIGLVARSHGMPMRDCVRVLEKLGTLREYRGIHMVYLMALLRVGDYLQIQSERAPNQLLKIKSIRSPLSLREWTAHSAIRHIGAFENDPEAVCVHAQPQDVYTFLRIKDWLGGIQHELDQSWAVLGEVYGRYGCLRDLGLTIRRVRSNLDDEKSFADTVDYVPELMQLRIAKAELIGLLLEPLYGRLPEVGIRELVQNAVDAVRERSGFERRRGSSTRHAGDCEPDVVVSVTTGSDPYVEVRDKGIGMSVPTLRDYFFVVGASFRQSHQWQREFETDGKSIRATILKSGRFGIGSLAAFLLGSHVSVQTRHMLDKRGVTAEFTLHDGPIELRFSYDTPVGTVVKIALSEACCDRLAHVERTETGTHIVGENLWDWYCLSEPRVERRIDGKVLSQRWTVPGPESEIQDQWRSFVPGGYQRVDWSYESGPALACNGILVIAEHSLPFLRQRIWDFGRLSLRFPNVSILDPDANLPLNLERNNLTTAALPFQSELRSEVIRDFEKVLVDSSRGRKLDEVLEIPLHKGLAERFSGEPSVFDDLLPFFAAYGGIAPLDPRLLWELDPHTLLYRREHRLWKFLPSELSRTMVVIGPVVAQVGDPYARSPRDVARTLLLSHSSSFRDCLNVLGVRILVTTSMIDAILGSSIGNTISRQTWKAKGWSIVEAGDCQQTAFESLDRLEPPRDRGEEHLLGAELFVQRCGHPPNRSPVSEIWRDMGGSPLISFDRR